VTRVRSFRPDLAVIMVAHRRETIALCDRSVTVGG
jgi:ABC-type bacteriocin/lantibiotic exporter with double-glycine peptidase domain